MQRGYEIRKKIQRLMGQSHRLLKKALVNTLTIFVYHEVSHRPSRFCETFQLNISPKIFAEHMDFLKEHFNLISPNQLLWGNYKTPAAMITFDDGFPGYFREAVPIMEKRNIPSLLFINIGPVQGEIFWSGLVTYLAQEDPEFLWFLRMRRNAISGAEFLSCDDSILQEYLNQKNRKDIESKARDFCGEFSSWQDIESVRNNPWVFLGNHLYNHYVAAHLTEEEFEQQFKKNEEWLLRFPRGCPVFAYPFGQPVCFRQGQTERLWEMGAKAVFCSNGRTNGSNPTRFYDRIGVNSDIHMAQDLLGLAYWGRLKSILKKKLSY